MIINTDGWISDTTAIGFKLEIIRRVNANYVVVIKRGNEVDELINKLTGIVENPPIIIPSSPNARIRDRDDRKIRREMGYSKYLMPSRDLSINLREKPIINLPLYSGLTYDRSMLRLIRRSLNLPLYYVEQWGGNVAIAIGNTKEFHARSLGGVSVAVLP